MTYVLPKTGKPFKKWFKEAGKQYDIPWKLLARIAQQESNFDPTAESPAGAKGLMQFMRLTAQDWCVDRNDPRSSIFGAARYLRWLSDRHDTWVQILAAYNWGTGNVRRKGINQAPDETRQYISDILWDIGEELK